MESKKMEIEEDEKQKKINELDQKFQKNFEKAEQEKKNENKNKINAEKSKIKLPKNMKTINLIVLGMAGSGKTNLAIHRALQAKDKGSYAIVIMTVALRRMIAYGMKALDLDSERIAYEWAWLHRGFDLEGDVYCVGHKEDGHPVVDDASVLYLVNGNIVRKFIRTDYDLSANDSFGIDFADWVADPFYRAWRRRASWFKEVPSDSDFNIAKTHKYLLVPSGTLYKPVEPSIDYLIVDEAQDFNVDDYNLKFIPKVNKSISLLGDSNQKMIRDGSSIQQLQLAFPKYKKFDLKYNYRIPKSVAKVAQKIAETDLDLLSDNLKAGGNSDYPNFPKPVIKKCNSREGEIKWIANMINNESLDDVAILVQNKNDVQEVIRLLKNSGINEVQTHYRTSNTVPFHTINTLDFSNYELPCILDYYAAKGSEFDNVFVPFANEGKVGKRNDFFVACTRSARRLFISYHGTRTSFLDRVNSDDVVEYK